jgi:sugar diacid utilization regulator
MQRVQLLATLLLADSPAARDLAGSVNMRVAERYVVMVVRIPGLSTAAEDGQREKKTVEALLGRRRVPGTWQEPGELVTLLPSSGTDTAQLPEDARKRALGLARDVARMLGQPCSVGVAAGRTGALAEVLALARSISRTARVQAIPRRLHTMADVFVELGVMQLPQVDRWMRELAQRLTTGPDLVLTLDTYYQNDMSRLNTAGALRIHPRTLDYRLHRVRQLVGIDPGSTYGVRILSTAVTRALTATTP